MEKSEQGSKSSFTIEFFSEDLSDLLSVDRDFKGQDCFHLFQFLIWPRWDESVGIKNKTDREIKRVLENQMNKVRENGAWWDLKWARTKAIKFRERGREKKKDREKVKIQTRRRDPVKRWKKMRWKGRTSERKGRGECRL